MTRPTLLRADHALDELAARNLVAYLAEQRVVTGALPTDRTIVDRALPRRARRLARRDPDAVRRPRPRAMVDGDRVAPARAPRARRAVHLVRRRDRGAVARGRGERWRNDRGRPAARPRRDQRPAHGRARRLGAVRCPLPRERRSRAPPAAPPPRPAHAVVDAAPEVGRPARGREPVRLVPDHPGDVPRGAARRLRCAGPRRPAGADPVAAHPRRQRRVPVGVALRQLAAVRLRRLVHVRG